MKKEILLLLLRRRRSLTNPQFQLCDLSITTWHNALTTVAPSFDISVFSLTWPGHVVLTKADNYHMSHFIVSVCNHFIVCVCNQLISLSQCVIIS
jgi:hypothetical protein